MADIRHGLLILEPPDEVVRAAATYRFFTGRRICDG